ncbi:MAG: hypothetical protein ACRDWB_02745, partial [Acidimicrobiales bacterium]
MISATAALLNPLLVFFGVVVVVVVVFGTVVVVLGTVVVVVVFGTEVVVVVTGMVVVVTGMVVVTGTVVVVVADTGTAQPTARAAARTAAATTGPIRPRREGGGPELDDPVIETSCAATRHPRLPARNSAGGLTLIPADTDAADDRRTARAVR